MRIAILGATSQIAKDLIVSFSVNSANELYLFARRPADVRNWSVSIGLSQYYPVNEFSEFSKGEFDAVINFVGVGNPAQAVALGNAIFEITEYYDDMVLEYLKQHPSCRYLFLSSGAAYGIGFNEPVTKETPAMVNLNRLVPHEWYGVAKLYAECRHRARPELAIIDIRVFNYFSHTQDINARFLVTDILRAIRDKLELKVSSDYIVRDFLHPSDFYRLICVLLATPAMNTVVDCYSKAPIDKPNLLFTMREKFGLCYEVNELDPSLNSTGNKPYYYSLNFHAADFGYTPSLTSLEGIVRESGILLNN
ncbi:MULTISPECIES: NAD-dependent epimerase/dehydratase family protein [Methylomonas]|uniref:Epimerase n=2 Tax=Methylomonas TaxID=416 RepID=A0A140E3W3_9GAMM|nr:MULTISPECIES: NAD-dependent epimerase/dehydratase family protein [Methylomonas]AMK75087.1 epimerase [Methylomonas denitrificans]OAI02577.1 epimerase [Methylomonas methanica]TCV83099.1 nucleoside-diphosphate-sugar epimerase [Methylomonas methanica]